MCENFVTIVVWQMIMMMARGFVVVGFVGVVGFIVCGVVASVIDVVGRVVAAVVAEIGMTAIGGRIGVRVGRIACGMRG